MTAPRRLGTGGWTPNLQRSDVSMGAGPAFLASENYTVKQGGATYAQSAVPADQNGDRILKAGTFCTPITAAGADTRKYGPYSSSATDGRQTADPNVSGFTLEDMNLRWGDVTNGLLIAGSVRRRRVFPSSAAAMHAAVVGRIIFQG